MASDDKEIQSKPSLIGRAIQCPPEGIVIQFSDCRRMFNADGKGIGGCNLLPGMVGDDIRVDKRG
jgi:hypothetical protein